jgi:DNA-binding NarL/FixJ family response regulator
VEVYTMSKIRVFLVDTQPIRRRGIALLLGQEPDIEVVGEASDGSDALRHVEGGLNADVILMDVTQLNLYATGHISEINCKVSVIFLSHQDNEDASMRVLQAGARRYLSANASVPDLSDAIRTVN